MIKQQQILSRYTPISKDQAANHSGVDLWYHKDGLWWSDNDARFWYMSGKQAASNSALWTKIDHENAKGNTFALFVAGYDPNCLNSKYSAPCQGCAACRQP